MKKNYAAADERMREELRQMLIRRMDEALDAEDPDMTVVDECSRLLDAIEHGSCQPERRRMRMAISMLAGETDRVMEDVPAAVEKPLSVRGVWSRVAACILLVLILPISVMMLRGRTGSVTEPPTDTLCGLSDVTDIVHYDGSVLCMNGDIVAQYPDLSSCMKYELPQLYYPTWAPRGTYLTTVLIEEEAYGTQVELVYSDGHYGFGIRESETPLDIPQEYSAFSLMNSTGSFDFPAYRWDEADCMHIMLRLEGYVYEIKAPDEMTAVQIFHSMRGTDTDHVHEWTFAITDVINASGEKSRCVYKTCDVCSGQMSSATENTTVMAAVSEETGG